MHHHHRTPSYALPRGPERVSAPQAGIGAFPFAERIRIAEMSDIGSWLRAGLADFAAAPLQAAFFGLVFVLAGFAMTGGLWLIDMLYLLTPLTAGFLIVGPALAVGIYDLSRQMEEGGRPSLLRAVFSFRRNAFHLLTAGLVLMLFLMIWVRLAALIFALFFPYMTMSLGGLVDGLATIDGLAFLGVGTVIGGVMAAVAFVFGAISLPLMLHHDVDVFTAALVSALAVAANAKVMAVWAAIIVALTGLALLGGYIGLIFVMPLLGHATWHAYRDLIDWDRRL